MGIIVRNQKSNYSTINLRVQADLSNKPTQDTEKRRHFCKQIFRFLKNPLPLVKREGIMRKKGGIFREDQVQGNGL